MQSRERATQGVWRWEGGGEGRVMRRREGETAGRRARQAYTQREERERNRNKIQTLGGWILEVNLPAFLIHCTLHPIRITHIFRSWADRQREGKFMQTILIKANTTNDNCKIGHPRTIKTRKLRKQLASTEKKPHSLHQGTIKKIKNIQQTTHKNTKKWNVHTQ